MTDITELILCYLHYQFVLCFTVLWWMNNFNNCSSMKQVPDCDISSNSASLNNKEKKLPEIKELNIFINTEDFKTLRLCGSVLVDKSEIINEYLERGGVVLVITRPRKWGKSVNINMFKRFFEIEVDEFGNPLSKENRVNRVLFTGGNVKLESGTIRKLKPLKVVQFPAAMYYHAKNPVILFSFKGVDGSSYQEFKNKIGDKVRSLYASHQYLKQYMGNTSYIYFEMNLKNNEYILDEDNLKNSIYYLSKLLYLHFKTNVYIFFDDFDTPIINAYLGFGINSEFQKVKEIIFRMMKKALKDNRYLERGILSGTFHLGWINEIFNFHNVRHTTIVDMTFSKFYGFTKVEIEEILHTTPVLISADIVKKWFNGFYFDGEMIHNPLSTLACLSNGGEFGCYWGDMIKASNNLMEKLYLSDSVQEDLHKLLQGKVLTRKEINKPLNLAKIEETFHRVLLFGGYLNPVSGTSEANCYTHSWNLSIPNREVREVLAEGVSKWVANRLTVSINDYISFTDLLVNIKIEQFKDLFQKYLLNSTLPKCVSEQQYVYHQLVSGMMSTLAKYYVVDSSRKQGQRSREYTLISYPDLGNDIIIIEYEVNKALKKLAATVETGMRRLIFKQYNTKLHGNKHVQRMIKIYIVFCRRKLALKYHISEVG